MRLKEHFPDSSTVMQIILLLIAALWFISRQIEAPLPAPPTADFGKLKSYEEAAMHRVENTAPDIGEQFERLNLYDLKLESRIQALLADGDFKQARTLLLELAAKAVEVENEKRLGDILLLLGGIAIDEQEINTAELLLQEALQIAIRQNDPMAMGRSYQQLGRLNIKTRALARYANEAYDQLWQVRNQIFRGEFRNAETNLQQVIDANMKIKRYGAAAAALETMADFHYRFNDDYRAEQAGAEAAKLYASSGQLARSYRIIGRLDHQGMATDRMQSLNRQIDDLFQQLQADSQQAARAQDLQMLYHYHLRNGDSRSAWQSRIEASRILAQTSERSMFQRQAEVMAILYSSNFAMDRAKRYLNQAGELFSGLGAEENAVEALDMQSLIY